MKKNKSKLQIGLDQVYLGDCLDLMTHLEDESVDLIYLDPPFFTQKEHSLKTRDGEHKFKFSDQWQNLEQYINYLKKRLSVFERKLKKTGSLFLHCDKTSAHYIKIALDEIFGIHNFQSEIIWTYRRWSNAKKGLLNNHQTIFFYSKSDKFKFNPSFDDYSPATNVDQIVQLRARDNRQKSVYQLNSNGNPILATEKKGVPIGDVWDIPFLNPKAKERVGYPTQKPIILIEKIIKLVTDEGDLVIDPFCGSGSTVVAAKLLKRKYLAFDINVKAISLAKARLRNPLKTDSQLLKVGRSSYARNETEILNVVKKLKATLVQRNKGIDGLISMKNQLVPFKVVESESELNEAASAIEKSVKKNVYKSKALYLKKLKNNKLILEIETKYGLIIFNSLKNLKQKLSF